MNISLMILPALVGTALFVAFLRGGWPLVMDGLKRSCRLLLSMWWRMVLGILLAGFIQVLLPKTLIADWIGPSSGLIGILIGSLTGMVLTGGPFVIFPIIASIYTAGAAEGPIIALLTAANLSRIQVLFVIEIPFLGTRIALSRYLICLLIPPLIGIVGSALFRLF